MKLELELNRVSSEITQWHPGEGIDGDIKCVLSLNRDLLLSTYLRHLIAVRVNQAYRVSSASTIREI